MKEKIEEKEKVLMREKRFEDVHVRENLEGENGMFARERKDDDLTHFFLPVPFLMTLMMDRKDHSVLKRRKWAASSLSFLLLKWSFVCMWRRWFFILLSKSWGKSEKKKQREEREGEKWMNEKGEWKEMNWMVSKCDRNIRVEENDEKKVRCRERERNGRWK